MQSITLDEAKGQGLKILYLMSEQPFIQLDVRLNKNVKVYNITRAVIQSYDDDISLLTIGKASTESKTQLYQEQVTSPTSALFAYTDKYGEFTPITGSRILLDVPYDPPLEERKLQFSAIGDFWKFISDRDNYADMVVVKQNCLEDYDFPQGLEYGYNNIPQNARCLKPSTKIGGNKQPVRRSPRLKNSLKKKSK